MTNFQREGAISNAHVGRDFEQRAKTFFRQRQNIFLDKDLKLPVGVYKHKKEHAFDLGNDKLKIIVECKSHTWTKGGNVPSAKLTVWNEAMYYFLVAPTEYRKILFVLKDYSNSKLMTLAEYYIKTYSHLIPKDVEIWEYDVSTQNAICLNR